MEEWIVLGYGYGGEVILGNGDKRIRMLMKKEGLWGRLKSLFKIGEVVKVEVMYLNVL